METRPARSPIAEDDTEYARPGETMWVLLNHIKADKREQFERFVREVLEPVAKQVEPNTVRHVRLLLPTAPNEDGSYTYIFLMDPVIDGADYTIIGTLAKIHGQEAAEGYRREFEACFAQPQIAYEVVQSPF
jgi:hypothetical protein